MTAAVASTKPIKYMQGSVGMITWLCFSAMTPRVKQQTLTRSLLSLVQYSSSLGTSSGTTFAPPFACSTMSEKSKNASHRSSAGRSGSVSIALKYLSAIWSTKVRTSSPKRLSTAPMVLMICKTHRLERCGAC